jgi:hypothetical protein
LYANQKINVDVLEVLLSKGDSVVMKLEFIKERPVVEILGEISHKILRCLEFLPYRKIKAYFNPF